MTNGHNSLEKYTSHTLRMGYVWEVSWRLNKDCNILTPSSSGCSSTSFSSGGAAQPGVLRAQLSAGSGSHCFELQQLTPNSNLQLSRTLCSTGLYNCLTSTCFSERRICTQFNPSTVKVIPLYLRPDALVIYTGAFLIWLLDRVGGQYVTLPKFCSSKSMFVCFFLPPSVCCLVYVFLYNLWNADTAGCAKKKRGPHRETNGQANKTHRLQVISY